MTPVDNNDLYGVAVLHDVCYHEEKIEMYVVSFVYVEEIHRHNHNHCHQRKACAQLRDYVDDVSFHHQHYHHHYSMMISYLMEVIPLQMIDNVQHSPDH